MTRTETFFGKPSGQTQMSFEKVKRVVITQNGINLESKQQEQLFIGSSMARGTNGELFSLEPKIAFFLNNTVQVDQVADSLWKPCIQTESPLQLVLEGEGHLHERWILDKESQTVTRTKTLGATSLTTANYSFSSIKEVEVELHHRGTVLFLVFESDARTQIAHSPEYLRELATTIAIFLKVGIRETIYD